MIRATGIGSVVRYSVERATIPDGPTGNGRRSHAGRVRTRTAGERRSPGERTDPWRSLDRAVGAPTPPASRCRRPSEHSSSLLLDHEVESDASTTDRTNSKRRPRRRRRRRGAQCDWNRQRGRRRVRSRCWTTGTNRCRPSPVRPRRWTRVERRCELIRRAGRVDREPIHHITQYETGVGTRAGAQGRSNEPARIGRWRSFTATSGRRGRTRDATRRRANGGEAVGRSGGVDAVERRVPAGRAGEAPPVRRRLRDRFGPDYDVASYTGHSSARPRASSRRSAGVASGSDVRADERSVLSAGGDRGHEDEITVL